MDHKLWEIINNLPSGSGVYGAKRSDKDGSIRNRVGRVWEKVLDATLPAIELRREKNGLSPSNSGYGANGSNSNMGNGENNVNGISDLDEKDKMGEDLAD